MFEKPSPFPSGSDIPYNLVENLEIPILDGL